MYEGNEKLILGLIWMLIQQYHIRVVGEWGTMHLRVAQVLVGRKQEQVLRVTILVDVVKYFKFVCKDGTEMMDWH